MAIRQGSGCSRDAGGLETFGDDISRMETDRCQSIIKPIIHDQILADGMDEWEGVFLNFPIFRYFSFFFFLPPHHHLLQPHHRIFIFTYRRHRIKRKMWWFFVFLLFSSCFLFIFLKYACNAADPIAFPIYTCLVIIGEWRWVVSCYAPRNINTYTCVHAEQISVYPIILFAKP